MVFGQAHKVAEVAAHMCRRRWTSRAVRHAAENADEHSQHFSSPPAGDQLSAGCDEHSEFLGSQAAPDSWFEHGLENLQPRARLPGTGTDGTVESSSIPRVSDSTERSFHEALDWEIFCDLDGVLVDFDRGVKKATGYSPGQWDEWDPGRSQMWRTIARRHNFFANLPWTRDGRQLWKFLEPLRPHILTGSPRGNWARPQKQQWCNVQLNVREECVHVVLSHEKRNFSGHNRLLIDDWEKYRDEWEQRGGVFVLHTSAASTIAEVSRILGVPAPELDTETKEAVPERPAETKCKKPKRCT